MTEAPEITEASLQADLTGFKPQQKADALALVLAGEVKPAKGLPGVFKVTSSSGKAWYQASRWDCGCPSRIPCKHQAAVILFEAREQIRKAA